MEKRHKTSLCDRQRHLHNPTQHDLLLSSFCVQGEREEPIQMQPGHLSRNPRKKKEPFPAWGYISNLGFAIDRSPEVSLASSLSPMLRSAYSAAGVLLLIALHGAAAFHMPSALPASRLASARMSASRPSLRTARVPMMMATPTPQKERTVRAPVFDEVCEQTGITLSRCGSVLPGSPGLCAEIRTRGAASFPPCCGQLLLHMLV